MLDRERILSRVADLDGYLGELESIKPLDFKEFSKTERKRACERLLQISIECVIDLCQLFVAGLKLGLPAEENDLFEKLARAGVISEELRVTLRRMKGFRNILVHEYGEVDDELVFDFVLNRTTDFSTFRGEVLRALHERASRP